MTTQWGGKLKTQVDGYVGFDSIQEQIRLNSLKRGFEFNVMVVGTFDRSGTNSVTPKMFPTRLAFSYIFQFPVLKHFGIAFRQTYIYIYINAEKSSTRICSLLAFTKL